MSSWKILYVQGRYEFKIEHQLEKLGIEHYLPKIQITKKWSDRVKKMTVPAFPSYIFVRTEEKLRNLVFQIKGVLHYLRKETGDANLSEEELNRLRYFEPHIRQGSLQTLSELKGKIVSIGRGLYAGHKAELVEILGKKTIRIKLENIAMGFLVEISQDDLMIS